MVETLRVNELGTVTGGRVVARPSRASNALRRLRVRLCTGPWQLALALGVATAQLACTSLDDLKRREPDGGNQECGHARVAGPPNVAADLGGSIEFVVATRTFDHGEFDTDAGKERFRSIGYDLDEKCTGQGEGPSCFKPTWVTSDGRDGPDGRDNAIGALLYASADGGSSGTQSASSAAEAGTISAVIRVRGYNGTSLDSEVEVAVYGATVNSGGTKPEVRPKWLGHDEWQAFNHWVDRDSTGELSADKPKYVARTAYVNNWILVAQFDRYRAPIYELSQVTLSARIVLKDERWHLVEGLTGGRVKTDEVLWAVIYTKDSETEGPRCTDAPSYADTKANVCATSDISFTGPDDGSMPCDATSWAWTFETLPARLKGVFVQELPKVCPDETSPLNDSCSTLGDRAQ
jgi:hypothetical protein